MTKKRIRLIHWQAAEARQRAEVLAAAGYEVVHEPPSGSSLLRELRNRPPVAVVVDLGRVPSHGREVALAIRHQKTTRHIPLVFVGGEAGKVERIRDLLPDAVFTDWDHLIRLLPEATAHPPLEPIAPASVFAAYAGRPVPAKLGIKPNTVVALVGAPEDLRKELRGLPRGVVFRDSIRSRADLTLWFTRSRAELRRGIKALSARTDIGPLWIAWPKRAANPESDLSQQVVRETGLAAGLVDYKICAIDAVWSALLFRRRLNQNG